MTASIPKGCCGLCVGYKYGVGMPLCIKVGDCPCHSLPDKEQPSPTDWEGPIRTLVGNAFGCDQKCEPESACTTCKETLVVLIREIESAAYQRGKDDAIDKIMTYKFKIYTAKTVLLDNGVVLSSVSEEEQLIRFHDLMKSVTAARTKEPFDKK